MISIADLKGIAKARIKDAEVLAAAKRYDGAVYLCGYAVEMSLKARICKGLKWLGYPATRGEFEGYLSFKTHDLDVLLHLSGSETKIKTKHLTEWSVVATWDPATRYRAVGTAKVQDATDMVAATKVLMSAL
jgi:hypothetical protein